MAPQWSRRQHGDAAEQRVCDWLRAQGLTLVVRNWQCRLGEIDLIMQHDATLVFIEVRLRRAQHFGGALASVDANKQHKLFMAAQHYLSRHPYQAANPCRFDVVALEHSEAEPQWIQNAFYGDA